MTHDSSHTACLELFEKLSEYLDDELDEQICQQIEAHASNCVACKACLETLRQTIALCRAMKQNEKPVPENFSDRWKECIRKMAPETMDTHQS
jgi:anti-sigma factor RsiW